MRPARLLTIPAVVGLLALSACGDEAQDAQDPTTPTAAQETAETGTDGAATQTDDAAERTDDAAAATEGAAVDHNEVDVDYATSMVDLHREAVALAELALEQGTEQTQGLAEEVTNHRAEEISELADWLARAGEQLPETQVEPDRTLEVLEGTDFDAAWMDALYEHDNAAIDLLHDQLADGVSPSLTHNATVLWEFLDAEMDQIDQLREGASR